jgi:hypothetical protein
VTSARLLALEPVAAAVLLAALLAALGALPDWRAELGRYQAGLALAFVAWGLALARRGRWSDLPGATAFVVVVALVLRAAVLPTTPALSDDVYRYVWEGRVLASGANPWRLPPDDPRLAGLRDDAIHPHVNHPGLAAIYPPLAEAGFALVAAIRAGVPAMKLWVLLHDLALCALLARWCARRGRPAWDAIAYAWNPLVVAEYAGSGHHDPVGIVWLVAALAWAEASPPRALASAAAAVAAVMVKLVPLAGVPFLWRAWPPRVRALAAVALAGSLAAYAWLALGRDSGLAAFAARWRHNDALFGPLAWALGERGARVAVALALAGIVVAGIRRGWDAVTGTRRVIGAALLLGPVVHPWYLGWVLALQPLSPSPAWLLLSALVPLGYGAFAPPAEGGAYHPPAAWRALEFGAPAILAVVLAWRSSRGRSGRVREAA